MKGGPSRPLRAVRDRHEVKWANRSLPPVRPRAPLPPLGGRARKGARVCPDRRPLVNRKRTGAEVFFRHAKRPLGAIEGRPTPGSRSRERTLSQSQSQSPSGTRLSSRPAQAKGERAPGVTGRIGKWERGTDGGGLSRGLGSALRLGLRLRLAPRRPIPESSADSRRSRLCLSGAFLPPRGARAPRPRAGRHRSRLPSGPLGPDRPRRRWPTRPERRDAGR